MKVINNTVKKINAAIAIFGAAAYALFAAIDPYSEDFSVPSGTNGWSKIQSSPVTLIQWNAAGYMVMNIQDDITVNEAIGKNLDGILENNELVEISVRMVNTHNNYYKGRVQLWDISETNAVLLTESSEFLVYAANHQSYKPVNVSLKYFSGQFDAGKTVQLRIEESCNGSQRDLCVDNVLVSSSILGITPYFENFSFVSGTNGWVQIQEQPATMIQWNSNGHLIMNVQDSNVGNESIGYSLDGVLENRETIDVTVRFVNTHNNSYRGKIQLWGLSVTDDTLLAESDEFYVLSANHQDYEPIIHTLKYVASGHACGKALQLRIKELCNGSQRNLVLDEVCLFSAVKYLDLVSYSEDFCISSDTNRWERIQFVPETLIQWDPSGSMVMNIQDETIGNESIGVDLEGVMLGHGEILDASVRFINNHNNYYKTYVQLWNKEKDALLAESEETLVYGLNSTNYTPVTVRISYSPFTNEVGSSVQLRIKESCNGSQRNIVIDDVLVHTSMLIENLGPALPSVNVRSSDFGFFTNGNFVAFCTSNGEPLTFNVIDLMTGDSMFSDLLSEGETLAGSVHQSPDGSVYFNVSQEIAGALYRYTPWNSTVTRIGVQIAGQSWLRDVRADTNGVLYISTYPNAKLLSYNPETDAIRDYGSVVSNATYAYCVEIVGDEAWVGTGPVPHLIAVHKVSGVMREIAVPAVFLQDANYIVRLDKRGERIFVNFSPGGEYPSACYNLVTDEWFSVTPSIGAAAGITKPDTNGIAYFISSRRLYGYDLSTDTVQETGMYQTSAQSGLQGSQTTYGIGVVELGGDTAVVGMTNEGNLWCYFPTANTGDLIRAEIAESSAKVVGFGTGPDGRIYTGAKIGVGMMGRINPSSHEIEALSGPSQAEGIGGRDNVILVGTYSGAGLYMGDLSEPWSWGQNPRWIFSMGRGGPYYQDRIWTIEAVGDRFALGSIPEPGQNGGALTFFNPVTEDYQVYRHVVTNQSVVDLSFKDGLLYGSTSIYGGSGTPPTAASAVLFIWDPAIDEKVWEGSPVPGDPVVKGLTWTPDGMLWGITETGVVFEFDPVSRTVLRSKNMDVPANIHMWGNHSSLLYDVRTDYLIGTAGGTLFVLDRGNLSAVTSNTEHEILRVSRSGNGNIYGICNTDIYFIELQPY